MSVRLRVEGFAIISANGMIADAHCLMPNSLKHEADQEFLDSSLERAALLVHGRKSHEGQINSHTRRRLLLTRAVATYRLDGETPNAWLWNPHGMTLDDVCRALDVSDGMVAILGGTAAYDMFLRRYAAFHLCRAGKVLIPNGTPVLSAVGRGRAPEDVLREAGLSLKYERVLDAEHALTHTCWSRS